MAIGKKERILTEDQLYSKKYYAERVRPKVEQALVGIEDNALRIKTTAKVLKDTWDQETKQIKDEIQAEHARLVKAKQNNDKVLKKAFETKAADLSPEECAM